MARLSLDNCLKCGGEILNVNYLGTTFKSCQNCGGFFIEHNKIQTARSLAESDGIISEKRKDQQFLDQAAMTCPKCLCHMIKKRGTKRKAVILDVCPSCQGVWFDEGEYAKFFGVRKKTEIEKGEIFKAHLYCGTCDAVIGRPKNEQNVCNKCGDRLRIALVTVFVRPFWKYNHWCAAILFLAGTSINYLMALTIFRNTRQAIIFSCTVGAIALLFLIRGLIYNRIAWQTNLRGYGIVRDFEIDS